MPKPRSQVIGPHHVLTFANKGTFRIRHDLHSLLDPPQALRTTDVSPHFPHQNSASGKHHLGYLSSGVDYFCILYRDSTMQSSGEAMETRYAWLLPQLIRCFDRTWYPEFRHGYLHPRSSSKADTQLACLDGKKDADHIYISNWVLVSDLVPCC